MPNWSRTKPLLRPRSQEASRPSSAARSDCRWSAGLDALRGRMWNRADRIDASAAQRGASNVSNAKIRRLRREIYRDLKTEPSAKILRFDCNHAGLLNQAQESNHHDKTSNVAIGNRASAWRGTFCQSRFSWAGRKLDRTGRAAIVQRRPSALS